MNWLLVIISVLLGYLLGSLSMSVIISKFVYRSDVRNSGSGNAGATNMARVYGLKGGVIVLLGDIAKALIAMGIAYCLGYIGDDANVYGIDYMCIAGAACLMGHSFPLFFNFKGGKCVTIGAAIALMVDWRSFLIIIATFIIVVAITKIVSVSSISAAFMFPVSYSLLICFGFADFCLAKLILSIFAAIFVIGMHHKNIGRLLKGEEKKFAFKKKDEPKQ